MNNEDKVVYLNFAGFQCLEDMYHTTLDLYLSTCGIQNCFGGHKFGPGKRDIYILHFVSDGKGEFTSGGKTYQLSKGDVFLIKPGTEVSYQADEKNPWSYMWVGFKGIKAEEYLKAAGLGEDNVICKCDNIPLIFSYIQKIIIYRHLSLSNELQREAALLQILSLIIENYKFSLPKEERFDYPYNVYVEQAEEYIRRNLQGNVKINDVASYIGIDRSYLTNIFKNVIGVSPQEYLLSCRMEKAEQLLRDTDKKISEIAQEVGYSEQMSFSKAFKKYKKVSPTEYRQS